MCYIQAIGTSVPKNLLPQDLSLQFNLERTKDPVMQRKSRLIYRSAAINNRHTVLTDFIVSIPEKMLFKEEHEPSTAERMQLYETMAFPIIAESVSKCLSQFEQRPQITHVVTFSCTGLYAPGLDIEIVRHFGLSLSTPRTCVNFMGCYAAFNALKVAEAICLAHDGAVVLVAGIELCTLHYHTPLNDDQLLANALFSDGAASCIVTREALLPRSLKINRFFCGLTPQKSTDMAWRVGNHGFDMILTTKVPGILREYILPLMQGLSDREDFDAKQYEWYAIHPGGKKILDEVEFGLGLAGEDTEASRHILAEFGNMSSVTILFVLEEILRRSLAQPHKRRIAALAFGPGLVMESADLEICDKNQ